MEGCRINSGVDDTSSIFIKLRLFPLIHAGSLVICTIIGLYSSFHALKIDCFLYNFCFCVKKIYLHEFNLVQCVFMGNYSGICNKCDFGLQQKIPSGEVLLNIWFELVSWLRGRYDSIKGESDAVERSRSKFLLKWGNSPMVGRSSSGPQWNYQEPRWLFPVSNNV